MDLEICRISFSILLLVCNVLSHPPIPVERDIVKKCMNEIGCGEKQIKRLKDLKIGEFQSRINFHYGALCSEIQELLLKNATFVLAMNHKLDILNRTLRQEIKTQNETLRLEIKTQNETLRLEIKTLNETLRTEIKTLNDSLCKTLNTEHGLRLYFQSLFDMGEFIEDLFTKSWPKWTDVHRPNKCYEERFWKILLMNIEDPKILALRKLIVKQNLSEHDFIELVQDILRYRNKDAHRRMSDEEKFKAYKYLQEKHPLTNPHVVEFLLFGITGGKFTLPLKESEQQEIDKLDGAIHQKISDEREPYKLMMFPKYTTLQESEDSLNISLEAFESDYSSKAKNVKISPVAFAVTVKAAFVLFEDFNGAYFWWNKRDKLGVGKHHRDSVVIVNANDVYFAKDAYIYIKIIANRKTICDEVNEIAVSNLRFKPLNMKTTTKKDLTDETEITVFLKYCAMESLLTTYEKLKPVVTNQEALTIFHSLEPKESKEMITFTCPNPTS